MRSVYQIYPSVCNTLFTAELTVILICDHDNLIEVLHKNEEIWLKGIQGFNCRRISDKFSLCFCSVKLERQDFNATVSVTACLVSLLFKSMKT